MNDRDADDFVDELSENPEPEARRDLSEAEKRLRQAQYYQLLLQNDFFDSEDFIAKQVTTELRAFITRRFEELLGMRDEGTAEVVRSDFTEDEVNVLKAVASKVMGRPSIVGEQKPKRTYVRKEEAPKQVQQQAKPANKTPPVKAKVRKAVVPDDIRESIPIEAPPPKVFKKEIARVQNDEDEEELDPDPSTNLPRIRRGNRIFVQAVGPNGTPDTYDDGSIRWRDITPQTVGTGAKPIPMPTGQGMEMAMATHAQAVVAQSEKGKLSGALMQAAQKT